MHLPALSPPSAHGGPRQPSRDDNRLRTPAVLLKGLRHLQAKGVARPVSKDKSSKGRGIRLQPISTVSKRANAFVEEADSCFDAVLHSGYSPGRRRSGKPGAPFDEARQGNDPTCLAGAAAAFESMVTAIEESLAIGECVLRVVRGGQTLSERIPARGMRRYKIPLPNRPMEVTIFANMKSGRAPSMWASTSDPNPGPGSCELRGKHNKLVYKHVVSPGAEEDSGVDRRFAAPSCRELYVTMEAAFSCQYELSITFGHANVSLTRQELATHIAKNKGTWEARVHELQRDPLAREEFDERMEKMRRDVELHRLEVSRGLNHVHRNKGIARDWSPSSRAIGLHKRALQSQAKHDECSRRRAELLASGGSAKNKSCFQNCGEAVCHTTVDALQMPTISLD